MFSGKKYSIKLPLIDNSKLIGEEGALCSAFAMQIVLSYHEVFSRNDLPNNFKLMNDIFSYILKHQDEFDDSSNEDNMKFEDMDLSEFDSLDRFYYSQLLSIWPKVKFSDVNEFMKNKILSYELSELFSFLYGFELLALSDFKGIENIEELSKIELEKYLVKYGPLIVKGNFGMHSLNTLNSLPKLGDLKSKNISYSIKKVTSAAFDLESEEAHHVVILPTENNETDSIFYIDPWDPHSILMMKWGDFRQVLQAGRAGILYFPCGIEPNLAAQNTVVTGENFTMHREIESRLQQKNNCCHINEGRKFNLSLNPINLANLHKHKDLTINDNENKTVDPKVIFNKSHALSFSQNKKR